ncbi:tyrosinase-like [Hemiscyllium ocellatum]|uniref:tyrosinase-like n=1 Tax=Hemiscyllium ocellatum TaxID=170820 RepID=UPI0029660529|nr:tyrosinase-like [Hemiscyllium ocellatum]
MSLGLELACALFILGTARAMVPIQCGTPAHMKRRECCPTFSADGSPCGIISNRGRCQDITRESPWQREERERVHGGSRDFRLWWPTYFFRRLCVCRGNYGGADCSECAYGWWGERCQLRHTVTRRDIAALPLAEQRRFVYRLHLAKVTLSRRYVIYASESHAPGSPLTFRRASVYNIAAYLHYTCAKIISVHPNSTYAHRGSAFLGWHRLLAIYLEQEIRNITGYQDFALPYWNWAGQTHCDVCTDQLFGASLPDGRLSPGSVFSNWTTYCSDDGDHQWDFGMVCPPVPGEPILRFNRLDDRFDQLPSVDDVRACLSIDRFDTPPYNPLALDSFRNALEGFINPQSPGNVKISMHNLMHIYCGGTLGNIFLTTNDPLFMPMHVFVDKLFEMWLRRHPGTGYPTGNVPFGHQARDKVVTFIPIYENRDMMKSCREFGYNYDDMEVRDWQDSPVAPGPQGSTELIVHDLLLLPQGSQSLTCGSVRPSSKELRRSASLSQPAPPFRTDLTAESALATSLPWSKTSLAFAFRSSPGPPIASPTSKSLPNSVRNPPAFRRCPGRACRQKPPPDFHVHRFVCR